MDLKILEIAANTENHKVLHNSTHQSKNKNRICGDEMEISLVVAEDVIEDMGYQCKSCAYCQASVSLLSRTVKQKNIKQVISFIHSAEQLFDDSKIMLEKDWEEFKDILDEKNIARKECLLLPLRTVLKALSV
jgi:nitrogen fixation protein NifU and related proteins